MVATSEWKKLFPNFLVIHLDLSKSDYTSIILHIDEVALQRKNLRRSFCFEEFWLRHDSCATVIRAAWEQPVIGVPKFRLVQKIMTT